MRGYRTSVVCHKFLGGGGDDDDNDDDDDDDDDIEVSIISQSS